jgi:hypothetical protein
VPSQVLFATVVCNKTSIESAWNSQALILLARPRRPYVYNLSKTRIYGRYSTVCRSWAVQPRSDATALPADAGGVVVPARAVARDTGSTVTPRCPSEIEIPNRVHIREVLLDV